jgi:hypothetical protein
MAYDELFTCDFRDGINSENLSLEDLEFFVDCSSCNAETAHTKLVYAGTTFNDKDNQYEREDLYFTIQCLGCKTISFCHMVEENNNFSQRLYPNRIAGQKELNDAYLLPNGVFNIYREIHASINNSLHVVAGIAIRAIIEAICKDKDISGRTLKDKITKMREAGLTTGSGEEILHNLRFLGNKAAHEIKAHSLIELKVALEVIDHLLLGVYILPIKTKILKNI